MSTSGRSIFYKVATKEDDYTPLLCNLMQRPEGRDFRIAVLEKLLGDRALASQIGSDHIRTQAAISGAGRPDLIIKSPFVQAVIEVKLNPRRGCTPYQIPTLNGYCKSLNDGPASHKVLAFLVPADWQYRQDIENQLAAFERENPSISTRVALWEEIFSLSKQLCADPLHLEFWRLLGSDFGPVEFTQEEVNVLMNGVGVPARAVTRQNRHALCAIELGYELIQLFWRGTMCGWAKVKLTRRSSFSAFDNATSPGSTTTATPRFESAVWIAISSVRGIWAGLETNSQKWLHSWNRDSGWVSWKYPLPISWDGIRAAIARTGTGLRCAS